MKMPNQAGRCRPSDRRHDHAHGQHDHEMPSRKQPRTTQNTASATISWNRLSEASRSTRPGGAAQADVAHRQREERRAGEDQRDHAEQARAHQRLSTGTSSRTSPARAEASASRRRRPRRRLGRGGDAGVDRPEHGRSGAPTGIRWRDAHFLGQASSRASRGGRAGWASAQAAIAREQRGEHDAGDAGDEQLRDRHVGDDAVDDHDDRRRDQQPSVLAPASVPIVMSSG